MCEFQLKTIMGIVKYALCFVAGIYLDQNYNVPRLPPLETIYEFGKKWLENTNKEKSDLPDLGSIMDKGTKWLEDNKKDKPDK